MMPIARYRMASDVRGIEDIHQCLKRIERILRNGLPHNDKDIAHTIAHAHAEIEQALEAINTEGWPR